MTAASTRPRLDRYYTIHGRRLPSVTTILSVLNKPQLVQWAANLTRDHIHHELLSFKRVDAVGFDLSKATLSSILNESVQKHEETRDSVAAWGHDTISAFTPICDNAKKR